MCVAIVSGVTGHLGSEVARQLTATHTEVHGLTRQGFGVRQTSNSNGAMHIHCIDGSIGRLIDIFTVVKPDVVFHVAGFSRREHQPSDVEPLMTANVLFGTQLLEAMRTSGCRRFITAGTYLQCNAENMHGVFNLYAATKQAFEVVLSYYVNTFGVMAAELILADVYSERDTRRKLMTDVATAWRRKSPLVVRERNSSVDLVHVEDAAAAFLLTSGLLNDSISPQGFLCRYSVTSGRELRVSELVAMFERFGERVLDVRWEEPPRPPRSMSPWRGTVVPGWTPNVSIEYGIKRIIKSVSSAGGP